jgi:hypothetical protein
MGNILVSNETVVDALAYEIGEATSAESYWRYQSKQSAGSIKEPPKGNHHSNTMWWHQAQGQLRSLWNLADALDLSLEVTQRLREMESE